MDLVEVNPQIGSSADAEKTLRVARSVILSALGDHYLQVSLRLLCTCSHVSVINVSPLLAGAGRLCTQPRPMMWIEQKPKPAPDTKFIISSWFIPNTSFARERGLVVLVGWCDVYSNAHSVIDWK
jgi:hypothetical protein